MNWAVLCSCSAAPREECIWVTKGQGLRVLEGIGLGPVNWFLIEYSILFSTVLLWWCSKVWWETGIAHSIGDFAPTAVGEAVILEWCPVDTVIFERKASWGWVLKSILVER